MVRAVFSKVLLDSSLQNGSQWKKYRPGSPEAIVQDEIRRVQSLMTALERKWKEMI